MVLKAWPLARLILNFAHATVTARFSIWALGPEV